MTVHSIHVGIIWESFWVFVQLNGKFVRLNDHNNEL